MVTPRISATSNLGIGRKVWQSRVQSVTGSVRRAQERTGKEMVLKAKELSLGAFSSADLAKLKHPYRIAGSPPQNPAIINRQTGLFYQSWRYQVQSNPDSVDLFVYNDAPYAKFMIGTVIMIHRPIIEKLQVTEKPSFVERLRSALRGVASLVGAIQ